MTEQSRPHMVLMDIHFASTMDGIVAAQTLRSQWDIPCAFLSAFGNEEQLARAKLAEPVGYLEKPFEEYELRELMVAVFKEC
jgi:CheY-like chemotaxis protein